MDQSPRSKYIRYVRRILVLLCLAGMAGPLMASPLLEGIHLSERPAAIALRFDADVSWRVYQTGPRELVIALRDAAVARDLMRSGTGAPVIQRIVYKKAGDGSATLIVETGVNIRSVESLWRAGVRVLEIRLEAAPLRAAHKSPRTELEKRERKSAGLAASAPPVPSPLPGEKAEKRSAPAVPERPLPGKIEVSALPAESAVVHGGIDTLLDAIVASPCGGMHVRIAVRQIEEDNCASGLDILGQGLMEGCEDVFSYLESWCRFGKSASPGEILALIRDLEVLVARKPDSPFVPWGYAMLGVLYHKLGNDPVGMGYFDLLRERVPDFAGMPEILLYLGRMHMARRNLEEAEPFFRDLVARFPQTVFAREARMELGRVMFERKRYFETLKLLEVVMREMPERMFTDPDLLVLVGNSHFHTGGYVQAIEALTRAYNDFPDMGEPSLVLTRIAEAYAALGEKDKARRLYELVRELYPGTDGFVVSSMRLAEMLEDRKEKDAIYQMVLDSYPDHVLARLALMRLAESRYQAEAYEEAVSLIRRLLSADPRALRRDALTLMGRALVAMFEDLLAAGDYPEVIRRYEAEKAPVFEMEKPEIHALVGRAYMAGHLYPQAVPEYQRAEMLWGGAGAPPVVRFEHGVAAMETGDRTKALEQFRAFLKEGSGDPDHRADAWGRIGVMRQDEGKDDEALDAYEKAAGFAVKGAEKARFLQTASRILRDGKKREEEAAILRRALAFLDGEGQDSAELRFELLRSLGESQAAQGLTEAAAASYAQAEGLSEIAAQDRNGVRFRLAETLEALGKRDRAVSLYRLLAEDGDPLWGSLAREWLAAMGIEKQLRES